MNPVEQRLKIILGEFVMSNASLAVQLEEAQKRIAELENSKPAKGAK